MSVVSSETTRRWSLVVTAVAVLMVVPAAVPAARDALAGAAPPTGTAQDLVRSALRAVDTVAYSGLASSRGGTSLPDLPRLGDVSGLLGGTTRTRVWRAAPDRWRVDTIGLTGEQDLYGTPDGLVRWDYEENLRTTLVGEPRVRFPRADDLLPPLAAHRLLGGVGPDDRLAVIEQRRRVAGRLATGVRVEPADPRGTVTSADVWLDATTTLPLAVTVRGPGGAVALDASFVSFDTGPPDPAVLVPPRPPGAEEEAVAEADLVQQIDRFARYPLPGRLAGLDRSDPLVTSRSGRGTATYGDGLARFVVLPLRRRLGGQLVSAAVSRGAQPLEVDGGAAYLLRSGVLTVVLAQDADGERTFLLSGLVDAETLRQGADELLAVRGLR